MNTTLTISYALSWRKPAGAVTWTEPHILVHNGIWVVWYLTDGKTWNETNREEVES
jgi:hypothetical protein